MTRDELKFHCRQILSTELWDDNAVANAADRMADLLHELTGKGNDDPRAVAGPPEEIGTGLYRMADGTVEEPEPESLIGL